MFFVKVNQHLEIKVWFRHHPPNSRDKMVPMSECIICRIGPKYHGVTQRELLGRGMSVILDPKEKFKFNKEVGRKLSLERALYQVGFNKEERAIVWNKYRQVKRTNK